MELQTASTLRVDISALQRCEKTFSIELE